MSLSLRVWTAVAVLMLPTVVLAQGAGMPPPIPTGPPIALPEEAPAWLNQPGQGVVPAGGVLGQATMGGAERPWYLTPASASYVSPPPAGFAGSACNFDAMCSGNAFSPDSSSFQILLGYYKTTKLGPDISDFNYVPLTLRHSTTLTSPDDTDGKWRGNWEFLCDFTLANVTSNYGNYFVGPSFLFRRNFVQPDAKLIPYTQFGAGVIYNDAHKDQSQLAIGGPLEFYLHAQVGVKYFVAPNWSIDLEGGLQHISNANLANRNLGVNAVGAQIGFTYYFPVGGR